MSTLNGHVAIVTGGIRGVGLGIAKRLACDGARLVLWDLDPEKFEIGSAGFEPEWTDRVDVGDEASVTRGIQRVMDRLGRIDILVNNAGVSGRVADVETYELAEWHRVMRVNLDGVFLCCKAVVPHMRAQGYGRIVNVASIAGKEGVPGIAAYAASKAAVIGLTKSLAREVIDTGILVNCLAPVMIETDLLKQMTPEHIERSKAKIPMGRLLQISELAALAAFAASPECSFTTGFTFDASGGRATY